MEERGLFLKPCVPLAAGDKTQTGSRTSYFSKYTGKGMLLVALKACGCKNTSKSFRAKLVVKNGIVKSEEAYKGTYGQNVKMLELIKKGRLIKDL